MKSKAEGNRSRGGKKSKELNTEAVEFTPGQWWQGDHNKGALASSPGVAGYPQMNMMAMMMMNAQMASGMAAAGGAPPPPPAKAPETPKAAAEAPAPDKQADATVPAEEKGD